MAAGDIQQRSSGMNDIQNLLAIFKGGPTTTVTSTSKEDVSTEKANAYIKSILESTQGLAQVSMGEKSAGMYNTSTGQLLSNDLLARTAAQAAALSSTKTNTQTSKTGAQLSLGNTLAVSGLKYLANPSNKFGNARNAYNYLDKFINGSGNSAPATIIASPNAADVFADGQSSVSNMSSLNYSDVLNNTSMTSSGDITGDALGDTGYASMATDLGAAAISSLFGESLGGAAATGGGYVVGSEGAIWGSAMGADAAAGTASTIGAATGVGEVGAAASVGSSVGEAAVSGGAEAGGFAAGAEALGLFGLGYTALNSVLASREKPMYYNPKDSAYYARSTQEVRDKWDAEYEAAIAQGLPGLLTTTG